MSVSYRLMEMFPCKKLSPHGYVHTDYDIKLSQYERADDAVYTALQSFGIAVVHEDTGKIIYSKGVN